jgi:hypothetical protein
MAMKRLVWSTTNIEGPTRFEGKLPAPPRDEGPVRDAPPGSWPETTSIDPHFYADSAVIAYRTPQDEARVDSSPPRVSSSGGDIDAFALLDGSLATSTTIASPRDGAPAWIQF